MSEIPKITDEDRAVGAEAYRLWNAETDDPSSTEIAAALARTGWKKVDEDLILAREVCAELWPAQAEGYRSGVYDTGPGCKAALAAIKAADARRKGDG